MGEARKQEIIKVTEQLLAVVDKGDYNKYKEICSPELTSYEPEGHSNLIRGLEFHRFFLDNVLSKAYTHIRSELYNPNVHLLGDDAAAISYNRLMILLDMQGKPQTFSTEETRVWHRQLGQWRCVHFHRSGNGSPILK